MSLCAVNAAASLRCGSCICCTDLTVPYRPAASFLPLSSAGEDAEFWNVLLARRKAPPRPRRRERLRRASGSAANRHVPRRSTKCLGSLDIDVAGEYHAAVLRRQVHARGMGFIRDVNVMRMRQCRPLPRSKFFLHGLVLFGGSPAPPPFCAD